RHVGSHGQRRTTIRRSLLATDIAVVADPEVLRIIEGVIAHIRVVVAARAGAEDGSSINACTGPGAEIAESGYTVDRELAAIKDVLSPFDGGAAGLRQRTISRSIRKAIENLCFKESTSNGCIRDERARARESIHATGPSTKSRAGPEIRQRV